MKRRLFYILPLFALLATFAMSVWQPKPASAATGYSYPDTSYKSVNGPFLDASGKAIKNTTYHTLASVNNPLTYASDGGGTGCTDYVHVTSIGATSGKIEYGCNANLPKYQNIAISAPNAGSSGSSQASDYVGQWLDHSHIFISTLNSGETFVDNKIDDPLNYKSTSTDTCAKNDSIDGFPDKYGAHTDNASATVNLHVFALPGAGNNSCEEKTYSLTFDPNTYSLFSYFFAWQDAGTISTSDQTGMIFCQKDGCASPAVGQPYLAIGGSDAKDTTCQSQITPNANDPTQGSLILRYNTSTHQLNQGWPGSIADAKLSQQGSCWVSDKITIVIANNISDNGLLAFAQDAGSSGLGDNNAATNQIPTLSCHVSWNPLTWLLCPAVDGMVGIVKNLDSFINSQLSVGTSGNNGTDPNQIFCDTSTANSDLKTCGAYYSAWNSVRLIALGLMVITGLVVVVAQAIGTELVDAYTIRKVLPRLLFAAVGITLSWQLMKFFVEFTNALGYGIRWIIYEPFVRALGNTASLGGGGEVAANLIGASAIVALGIFGLLSFAATAALAVFVAFLVLVIRQLLIIILVILAPVAIVMYILPNTKKMYDIWWDSFAKALLMFPLITAFIAAGRVFALVANKGGNGGPVGQLMGFAAYFAPYFLLPLTFKFAGGALANIGGFVNDRHRGAFDRLRKHRQETAADRIKRARSNSLWDNNSRIGRRANTLAGWGTAPLSNAAYAGRRIPGLRKSGLRIASGIEQQKVEQSGKLFEELNKAGYNDKAYRALTGQWDDKMRDEFTKAGITGPPTTVGELQKVANVMKGMGGTNTIGGEAIEGSIGRLANLYRDQEMTKANLQAAGIMGLAAHGFASGDDLAGTGNDLVKSGGASFAQSVISQAQMYGARSRPDTKPGYGVKIAQNDKGEAVFMNGMRDDERMSAVLDTFSAQDLAGAKGGAFDSVSLEIERRLDGSKGQAFQTAMRDQLFSWAGPYSQASADIKAKALNLIQQRNAAGELVRPELAAQFDNYARTEYTRDPNQRGGPRPEEEPPQGGGGGPR